MRHPIMLLATALMVLPLGGCYVVAQPAAPVVAETYEPDTYDGNIVYYDTAGAPFFYVEGGIRYVPPAYVHYDVLVGHYRNHARAYHEWYEREGRRQAEARRDRDPRRGSDRERGRHERW